MILQAVHPKYHQLVVLLGACGGADERAGANEAAAADEGVLEPVEVDCDFEAAEVVVTVQRVDQ